MTGGISAARLCGLALCERSICLVGNCRWLLHAREAAAHLVGCGRGVLFDLPALLDDLCGLALEPLGLASEPLWLALRENLEKFSDVVELGKIVKGPVEPVIADEDRDFIATARDMLPAEPWDLGTWALWTNALKEKTGRKGKSLFLPLRLALTGRHDGPELKSLLPLLGRKASLDRLL